MSFRPGDLLGLPPGFPGPEGAVAFRYALLAAVVLWAFLLDRRRWRASLGAGVVFVVLALSFRAFSLNRPYGLLVETETTRQAIETVLAEASPGTGPLALMPPSQALGPRLVSLGLPARLLVQVPTLLPLLVVPALGLLLALLLPSPRTALLAGTLFLAFPTTELEALDGSGLVSGLWARPAAGAWLLALAPAVLGLGRLVRCRRRALVACGAVAVVGLLLPPDALDSTGLASRAWSLLLGPGPWVPLALLGLAAGPVAPAAVALAGSGAVLALLGPLLLVDPWLAQAVYRLGLAGAAAVGLDVLARRLVRPVTGLRLSRTLALVVLFLAPGSFLARWNPTLVDETAAASAEPIPTALEPGLRWLRQNTPPGAVCVSSPEYAAHVALLGARPLLRAPALYTLPDEDRRRRFERRLLHEKALPRKLALAYRVRYVVAVTGDRGWPRELDPASVPALRPLYSDRLVQVFEVAPPADASPSGEDEEAPEPGAGPLPPAGVR